MSSVPVPRVPSDLRVALLAGTLGQGGAEKQLVYVARALAAAGIEVRIYSLTRGEFYEAALRAQGLDVVWVGRAGNPMVRIAALAAALARYRPHVVHAFHFYANLYAVAVAPLVGAVAVGSLRNDAYHEVEANGRWGRPLLHWPRALVANSLAASENARRLRVPPERIRVLPNVIDLDAFDAAMGARSDGERSEIIVAGVARLVAPKRLDRWLGALAAARQRDPRLQGILIGDGPERARLVAEAARLDLLPRGITFLGRRDDVPGLLGRADMLLLTSDHEGFPNVLLEAMAAGVPVVTTPAGDAATVVADGETGFVVPFDAIDTMAERLIGLAADPVLRHRLGHAGRRRVAQVYGVSGLGPRIIDIYTRFIAASR